MNLDQFDGHTPGPWAPVELMAFAAGFAVEDAECRTVARIMKTHEVAPLPARANAALIAAAPELLSEVRRLTTELAQAREVLRSVECSYSGMLYGDDKAGGPSEYTRGWGDCLRAIKSTPGGEGGVR